MTDKLTQNTTLSDGFVNPTSNSGHGYKPVKRTFETEIEKEIFLAEVRRITQLILSRFPETFKYQKDLVLDFGLDGDLNNEAALYSFMEIQLQVMEQDSPHAVAKKVITTINDFLEDGG